MKRIGVALLRWPRELCWSGHLESSYGATRAGGAGGGQVMQCEENFNAMDKNKRWRGYPEEFNGRPPPGGTRGGRLQL